MIDLKSINALMQAGFGDAVEAANALIGVKNSMAANANLKKWVACTPQDFIDEYDCGQATADAMVETMAALKACFVTIRAQDFPPNVA